MINYFILILYLHLYLDSVQAARKWNVNHYLRVFVSKTSDLEMWSLWGPLDKKVCQFISGMALQVALL